MARSKIKSNDKNSNLESNKINPSTIICTSNDGLIYMLKIIVFNHSIIIYTYYKIY